MHEKCEQCRHHDLQWNDYPYGCYGNGHHNCREGNMFPEFEQKEQKEEEKKEEVEEDSCKHAECNICTNRVVTFDPKSSTHLQHSCFDKINDDPALDIPGLKWEDGCEYKCPLYKKREPEKPVLVKCVNCQHARDIRGDMEVYTCICTPDPPEMVGERHLLGHDRECPDFVEKTCTNCKFKEKFGDDIIGCDPRKWDGKIFLDVGYCDSNAATIGGLGRYAWEPIKIPEKEKEKKIEWLWVAPCTDCDFWKERPLSTSEIICGMGVTIKCTYDGYNQSERPCKWYKQKEPAWAWEADCGDCTCQYNTKTRGNLVWCGYRGKSYSDGMVIKYNRNPGVGCTWHRYKNTDFHDCEGYTPAKDKCVHCESTNTEKYQDGIHCLSCGKWNHKKYPKGADPGCDNCGQDDDGPECKVCNDTGMNWVPRSCENCGHNSEPYDIRSCDIGMGLSCGAWSHGSPSYEYWISIKQEPAKSCETCGNRHENGTCIARHPERYDGYHLITGDAVKCRLDGTWRSWTPISIGKGISEQDEDGHVLVQLPGKVYIPEKTYFEWEKAGEPFHIGVYPGLRVVEKDVKYIEWDGNEIEPKKDNLEFNEEVIEMNEKNKHRHYIKIGTDMCMICGERVDLDNLDDKNEDKKDFKYTCPSCGTGDDQRENYCAHCGYEFGTRTETVLEAMLPENCKERTRKTRKTRKAVRMDTGDIGCTILGIISMTSGILTIIYMFDTPFAQLGLLATVIGFMAMGMGLYGVTIVDVPRIPIADRISAWRQARKDKEKQTLELELEHAKTMARLHEKNLELAKQVIEKKKLKIEEWKQTAANLTRQYEEDRESQTRAFTDKYDAILADRDANWIPRSNKLDVGVTTVETKESPGIRKFYIRGDIYYGVKGFPKRDKILLFSADVIKKDGED